MTGVWNGDGMEWSLCELNKMGFFEVEFVYFDY